MAIAAAGMVKAERVVTLAAPWNFARYPERSRAALHDMWRHSQAAAKSLDALPMEVLQAAFWSLDPQRTVRKFAGFGRLDPTSPEARRFIQLEDWANEGEPLPYPAARELIEDLFGADLPGSGAWQVGGRPASDNLGVPALHLLAGRDLIAPPETAPSGETVAIAAGHVGMIVGSARSKLQHELERFLDPACR
jgi:polyhydroxyalkanoate synthase